MKKFLLSFILSFSITFAFAQDYKTVLTSLMRHSETDFVKIIGKKIDDYEVGYTTYESKLKLSDEEDIIQVKDDGSEIVYRHMSTKRNKESLENTAYLFMEKYFPETKYDIQTEDAGYDGSYYIKRIYRKTDDYPCLVMSLLSDVHIDTKFRLAIFGKSTLLKE